MTDVVWCFEASTSLESFRHFCIVCRFIKVDYYSDDIKNVICQLISRSSKYFAERHRLSAERVMFKLRISNIKLRFIRHRVNHVFDKHVLNLLVTTANKTAFAELDDCFVFCNYSASHNIADVFVLSKDFNQCKCFDVPSEWIYNDSKCPGGC